MLTAVALAVPCRHGAAQSAAITLEGGESILVAQFGGSTLTTAAFGAELADDLERHLAMAGEYAVVTPDALRDLLPRTLAEAVAPDQSLLRTALLCVRARQLAVAAKVSVVVCGTVRAVESDYFEVFPAVYQIETGQEHMSPPLAGRDPARIALELFTQLSG